MNRIHVARNRFGPYCVAVSNNPVSGLASMSEYTRRGRLNGDDLRYDWFEPEDDWVVLVPQHPTSGDHLIGTSGRRGGSHGEVRALFREVRALGISTDHWM